MCLNDNTSFFLKATNAIPAFYKCYCSGNVHDNVHVHVIVQEIKWTLNVHGCMLFCGTWQFTCTYYSVGNVMLLDGKCTCNCTINVHVIVQ